MYFDTSVVTVSQCGHTFLWHQHALQISNLQCYFLFCFRYKCHLKFSWAIPRTPIVEAKAGVVSGFSHKTLMTPPNISSGRGTHSNIRKTSSRQVYTLSYCILPGLCSMWGKTVSKYCHPRKWLWGAACCFSCTLSGTVLHSSKMYLLLLYQVSVCLAIHITFSLDSQ